MKQLNFFVILCSGWLSISYALAKDIKLVTGIDYAPYASPDLHNGGVITDVVSSVFRELGYRVDLKYYPWTRGMKRVASLESDVTFPYSKTDKREEDFLFSRPVNRLTVSIFQNVSTARLYRSPKDLVGLTYCQPLGYKTEKELGRLLEIGDINRFRADTVDSCLERLGAGRADFVALNSSVVWAAANRVWSGEEEGVIEEADVPLHSSTEHVMISRNHPAAENLITEFNQAYQSLLDAGKVEEIWVLHLGQQAQPAM